MKAPMLVKNHVTARKHGTGDGVAHHERAELGVGVADKVTDVGGHVQVAGAFALGQSEHVANTTEHEQLSVGTRTLPKRIVGRHEAIPAVDVLVMHDGRGVERADPHLVAKRGLE